MNNIKIGKIYIRKEKGFALNYPHKYIVPVTEKTRYVTCLAIEKDVKYHITAKEISTNYEEYTNDRFHNWQAV